MERYNIFNQVHKGLRAFLYDTALQVQQTDFTCHDEAALTLETISEALYHFSQHAYYMERFLFPYIKEYNPALTETFKLQYQANIVLSQRLKGLMNIYYHAVSSADKTDAGRPILKAFTAFLVTNLDYMSREDNLINNTLWRHYNDKELLGLEKEIVANLPPKDLAAFSKWMIRGLNNTEIIEWLRAIEKTTIIDIFHTFFACAEKELPEGRWMKIQEALAEGSLLA
jgi:hypothetical protein